MSIAGDKAGFNAEGFRKDHIQILASKRELASIKAVNVLNLSGGYDIGQVLARDTGDGVWKKWSAVSGSANDSVCILFEDVLEESATGSQTARALFGGEVFESKLTDFDSGALTAMNGRSVTDALGSTIVKF